MKRMKELEDENRRLKKMYAEEKFKSKITREAIEKIGKAASTMSDDTNDYGAKIIVSCVIFLLVKTATGIKRSYRLTMLK